MSFLRSLFSDPLPVGSPAPDFTAEDQDRNTVTLSALKGQTVVLVFYPGDDTPTCTVQLCELRDNWQTLQQRGIRVFGVNPRGAASHQSFREKFNLPFPLLIDRGGKLAAKYNAGGALIVRRTVYAIGPDGTIQFAQRGKPTPAQILATSRQTANSR